MRKRVAKLLFSVMMIAAFTIQAAAAIPDELVPMGNTVGIQLQADGLLVVGFDAAEDSIAKTVGLRKGDVIKEINGKEVTSAQALRDIFQTGIEGDLIIKVERDGKPVELCIQKELLDSAKKLGIFVRDSMAGIGTITYLNPENDSFGALGHGVEDSETMTLLPLKTGTIMPSEVVDRQIGQRGQPGALKGIFDTNKTLGTITSNTSHGLFGTASGLKGRLPAIEVATPEQIHTGKATILSNVQGKFVEEFEIEIEKLFPSPSADGRNMLILVTDPRLLELTGGIVQGMSGSPILQDGRIIGAVTHVLVNDPTRGYGIFITNMLEAYETCDPAA